MSKEIINEIDFLEKNLKELQNISVKDLDFVTEAAVIRMFEVIGGIAKNFDSYGVKTIKEDEIWQKSINTRDKISHSYFSLKIEYLLESLKDIPHLLSTIDSIKKEITK